jgi:predicted ester cyclase
MPTPEDQNVEVVRRFIEDAFVGGDLDVVDDVIAEGRVGYDAHFENIHGRNGTKEAIQAYHEGFPDLDLEIIDLFGSGDRVVVRYRTTGTHEGPFMGIEPTQNAIDITVIDLSRLEDGMIVETWAKYDVFTLLQQLDIIPPTDELLS